MGKSQSVYGFIFTCKDTSHPWLDETVKNSFLEETSRKEWNGRTFFNTWITNETITADNIAHLASCARTRWKIENEHNNVLKNHGYNLEHNFGHGKEHASEMYCLLNLLAFQMHSLLVISDEDYQKRRACSRRRDEFFNELQFLIRFKLFDCW